MGRVRQISAGLEHERQLWAEGFSRVAGVDEVGVGPLAGPLSAAAVILPPETRIEGLRDSKQLTAKRREYFAEQIQDQALAWSVVHLEPAVVDAKNPYQASREAMAQAVLALEVEPDALLVDARHVPRVSMPQQALLKGDARSQSIAAASVLAKVARDRLMVAYEQTYPGYGFARHKGYGTRAHREALMRLGPTGIHRRTYAPVRQAMAKCGKVEVHR